MSKVRPFRRLQDGYFLILRCVYFVRMCLSIFYKYVGTFVGSACASMEEVVFLFVSSLVWYMFYTDKCVNMALETGGLFNRNFRRNVLYVK